MTIKQRFLRRLVCPYCGDVKDEKMLWQGRLVFYDNLIFPFNIGWWINWDRSKTCRCDRGEVMPPHMHSDDITQDTCEICLKWRDK